MCIILRVYFVWIVSLRVCVLICSYLSTFTDLLHFTALPGFERIVETNYTFDVKFVLCGQMFGEEDIDLNWNPFECEVSLQ